MNIKKKEVASEIFTGSMADISFLLIIYFMITSAFSADRGMDFALPEDMDRTDIGIMRYREKLATGIGTGLVQPGP